MNPLTADKAGIDGILEQDLLIRVHRPRSALLYDSLPSGLILHGTDMECHWSMGSLDGSCESASIECHISCSAILQFAVRMLPD